MSLSFTIIVEAMILASSLSLDSFTTGFAYGSNKIKISLLSVQIITLICSAVTGLSFLIGNIIKEYIPSWVTIGICFTTLLIMGIVKLLDSITKSFVRKHTNLNKEIEFSFFNFKFILNLYANPENADVDSSKTISPLEATSLAIALSLDGLAVRFWRSTRQCAWTLGISIFTFN